MSITKMSAESARCEDQNRQYISTSLSHPPAYLGESPEPEKECPPRVDHPLAALHLLLAPSPRSLEDDIIRSIDEGLPVEEARVTSSLRVGNAQQLEVRSREVGRSDVVGELLGRVAGRERERSRGEVEGRLRLN